MVDLLDGRKYKNPVFIRTLNDGSLVLRVEDLASGYKTLIIDNYYECPIRIPYENEGVIRLAKEALVQDYKELVTKVLLEYPTPFAYLYHDCVCTIGDLVMVVTTDINFIYSTHVRCMMDVNLIPYLEIDGRDYYLDELLIIQKMASQVQRHDYYEPGAKRVEYSFADGVCPLLSYLKSPK